MKASDKEIAKAKYYPGVLKHSECVECGVTGGIGDPPLSSDGVLENKFPLNSDTSAIGELFLLVFFFLKD